MKPILILMLSFLLAVNHSLSAHIQTRWDFTSGNFLHQLELSAGKRFADPEVTIGAVIFNGFEDVSPTDGSFIIHLSSPQPENITVHYTVSGTATGGVDYTIPASVEIPFGFGDPQLPVTVMNDMILEGDETVTVTLTSAETASGVAVPVVGTATLLIKDDDYNVTNSSVTFGTAANAEEGGDAGSIIVSLPPGYVAGEDITVSYSLIPGTTTAATGDYVPFSFTAIIKAGEREAIVPITSINDTEIENEEVLDFELNSATGATLTYGVGPQLGTVVSIVDNDARITIYQTINGEEGVKNAGFILRLPPGIVTTEDISINYKLEGLAANGTDYTSLSGTIILPAGSSSVPLDILVTDDEVIETTEDVILDLQSASGVSSNINFTMISSDNIADILDNDNTVINRVISISAVNGKEPNVNGSFIFSLPGNYTCSELIRIFYTVSGTAGDNIDYVKLSGSVQIPNNKHSSNPVALTIKDDLIIEGDETVIVTITSAAAAPSGAVFTASSAGTAIIGDDDNTDMGITVTATDANAAEPADGGKFTIALPGGKVASVPVKVSYTISGTAKDGTDYTSIPLFVDIPAGTASADVSVDVRDDNLIEGDETVTATISSIDATLPFVAGTQNNATVLIVDDDDTDMSVGPEDNDGDASNGLNGINIAEPSTNGGFTISVAPGKRTSVPITVTYILSGTATDGKDYETAPAQVVIEAETGSADIPLNVIDDELIEGEETVTLTITGLTTTLAFTPVTTEAVIHVIDDDIPKVDLVLTKTVVQPGPYTVGQDITYRITVSNTGNIPATEVVVKDSLPAVIDQAPVATVLKGTVVQNGSIIIWTIDQLEIGETLEMLLVCRASDGGTLTNTASGAAKETEGKPTDNTAASTIRVDGDALIIPNVFTPNGDGKNEKFDIGGLDKYPSSTLYVYNRWGAMVYQSKNYQNNWTGTGLNAGSYFYTLEVRKAEGTRVYKGWVEILR